MRMVFVPVDIDIILYQIDILKMITFGLLEQSIDEKVEVGVFGSIQYGTLTLPLSSTSFV